MKIGTCVLLTMMDIMDIQLPSDSFRLTYEFRGEAPECQWIGKDPTLLLDLKPGLYLREKSELSARVCASSLTPLDCGFDQLIQVPAVLQSLL